MPTAAFKPSDVQSGQGEGLPAFSSLSGLHDSVFWVFDVYFVKISSTRRFLCLPSFVWFEYLKDLPLPTVSNREEPTPFSTKNFLTASVLRKIGVVCVRPRPIGPTDNNDFFIRAILENLDGLIQALGAFGRHDGFVKIEVHVLNFNHTHL